ncbi:MAG: hypothetical protein AB4372_27840 [Xenococcus sp. (in: cyanobacteria)]
MPEQVNPTPVDLGTLINNQGAQNFATISNNGMRFSAFLTNNLMADISEFPSDPIEAQLASRGYPSGNQVYPAS